MLIVYANGRCGINFEHSPVDGAQMIYLAECAAPRRCAASPRRVGPA